MKHMIVVVLGLVLVACGGGTAQSTADDVHRQFVEALRTNDRATLEALAEQTSMGGFGQKLETIQRQVNNEMVQAADGATGTFQGVEVRPLTARGVGQRGISVWRSTDKVRCWVTELAELEQGWKVVQFNLTNDATECPDA